MMPEPSSQTPASNESSYRISDPSHEQLTAPCGCHCGCWTDCVPQPHPVMAGMLMDPKHCDDSSGMSAHAQHTPAAINTQPLGHPSRQHAQRRGLSLPSARAIARDKPHQTSISTLYHPTNYLLRRWYPQRPQEEPPHLLTPHHHLTTQKPHSMKLKERLDGSIKGLTKDKEDSVKDQI